MNDPESRTRQGATSENPEGLRLLEALGDRNLGWLSRETGIPSSTLSDIVKKGFKDARNTVKIAAAVGVDVNWLVTGEAQRPDLVQTEVRGMGAVGAREVSQLFYGSDRAMMLPLYGSAIGGEYGDFEEHIELTELDVGEALDYLARPASLANDPDAYALTIVGDSMEPRFRPGERVSVSPRSPVAIGDDVIVQLRGGDGDDDRVRMVLVKELVRRTATHVELRQYNPPTTFRVETKKVAAMHKVKNNFF